MISIFLYITVNLVSTSARIYLFGLWKMIDSSALGTGPGKGARQKRGMNAWEFFVNFFSLQIVLEPVGHQVQGREGQSGR